jgi:ABC-type phosphate transport system substrate-binding protein
MDRPPIRRKDLSPCPSPSRRRLLAGLLMLPATPLFAQGSEIVVIVHPDNPYPIDRRFLQRLYTGTIKAWPDGSPAFALDLPEDHALRNTFSQELLGRSVANVRAVWSQNIFTGKGLPPRITSVEAEMRRLVAANRNAIGYISAAMVDATVKAHRV